jgi:hypothetical protein
MEQVYHSGAIKKCFSSPLLRFVKYQSGACFG